MSGVKLQDIFNPMHNLKEICKEFVLLEDHLSIASKHCPDCIRKHLLKAEAFAEEAIALDKNSEYNDLLEPIPEQIRNVADLYHNSDMSKHQLGQHIRRLRKTLSPYCFNKGSSAKGSKLIIPEIPAGLDITEKPVSTGSETSSHDSIVSPKWDFWSGVASEIGLPVTSYVPFCDALKSVSDMPIPPYFELSAPGVSYRVRSGAKWTQKQLVSLLNQSMVKEMVNRHLISGKQYSTEDWVLGINSALGRSEKRVKLDTPSSSLGEFVDNREVVKDSIKNALENDFLDKIKEARRLEKKGSRKAIILSAVYYDDIGDKLGDAYFWAKAANLYRGQNKLAEEARSLSKIIQKYPDHELKFWISNRVMIFDKRSSDGLKELMPEGISGGSNNNSDSGKGMKETLFVIGAAVAGFLMGMF